MPDSLQLTDDQVENWRKVLCRMFGPWALLMPREDVVKCASNIRRRILDEADREMEEEERLKQERVQEKHMKKEPEVDKSMAAIWKRKLDQRSSK